MTRKVMLLDEPPMVVQRSLATALGLNRALFLQQLHFMVSRYGKFRADGKKWLRWSLPKWHRKVFPFWSVRTIQRIIQDLEEQGWVLTAQEPGSTVRYTLEYDTIYTFLDSLSVEAESSQSDYTPSQTDTPPSQPDYSVPPIESIKENKGEKRTEGKPSGVSAEGKTAKSLEGKQKAIRQGHEKKFRAAFAKKQSVQSVEKLWEMLVVEHHGRDALVPFTPADRKNTKGTMISFCEKARIDLIDLMEYAIVNWDTIRLGPLKWAKLDEHPSYRALFGLKDKFLQAYRKGNGKGGAVSKETEIYTRIEEVPKGHPRYKEIVLSIRTTGKAVLR